MSSVTKQHICAKAKRKSFISNNLKKPEVRKALAQSIVEPIRKSLKYKATGRNIFF